jgi:hypothetical protein
LPGEFRTVEGYHPLSSARRQGNQEDGCRRLPALLELGTDNIAITDGAFDELIKSG